MSGARPLSALVLGRILESIAWILLGVALGLGSVATVGWALAQPFEERFGPWRGTGLVGRAPANPWERVATATRGLVGLPRGETIYLEARADEDGRFMLRMHGSATGPAELPLDDEPGTFVVLRLYHPDVGVAERLGEIEWPRIQRESCP